MILWKKMIFLYCYLQDLPLPTKMIIKIITAIIILYSAILCAAEFNRRICEEPFYHFGATYMCHCKDIPYNAKRSIEINALVISNCEGFARYIIYPCELFIIWIISLGLSIINILKICFG